MTDFSDFVGLHKISARNCAHCRSRLRLRDRKNRLRLCPGRGAHPRCGLSMVHALDVTLDCEAEKIPSQAAPETEKRATARGADNGNRTRLLGLGSRCSTDKLYPRYNIYIIHQNRRSVNSFFAAYDGFCFLCRIIPCFIRICQIRSFAVSRIHRELYF